LIRCCTEKERQELKEQLKQRPSQVSLKNGAEDGQEEQDSTWTGSEAESDDDTPFFDNDLVGAGAERHGITGPEALSLPLG